MPSANEADGALQSLVRKIPKAELHLHLEGSVSGTTAFELARKHDVRIPFNTESELYVFETLGAFLTTYDVVADLLRDAEDFRRVTLEMLERLASAGGRYAEFFFNPQVHLDAGVSYGKMLDGIVAGLHQAERAFGIQAAIIPANNRQLGPIAGERFLDLVLSDRRPEVIGIGMDYDEVDPRPFAPMYERARAAGLHATVHVGDRGPAQHVQFALDLLGCERIDHGYHVLDDEALMERCLSEQVPFNACPTSSTHVMQWKDLRSPDHAIRRMIDAGLCVTLNTDDPGLFRIDLAHEFYAATELMAVALPRLKELALNGIRASWLSDPDKDAIVRAWSSEIDVLYGASSE